MTIPTQPVSLKFGPYNTVRLIGSGGQSAVYNAIHDETQRMVVLRAMTIIVKDVQKAIKDCEEVLAEIIELNVPNSVAIENYGHDGNTLYIAMNLMNGGTLFERMRQRHSNDSDIAAQLPSPGEVLQIVERIAIALDSLHTQSIVHGQLEPGSIMFNDNGEAFLADIGLTRLTKILYRLETTNSFNMTKYSAPELWDGYRPKASTDQYALACIIYELLTGQAPFNASSIFDLMQAHANDVAAPPHYIREGLPGSLAMTFWQALAKPVDRRFPSIMAFYESLHKVLKDFEGEPTGFLTFKVD
jgi:serine/threonine-protein kinase